MYQLRTYRYRGGGGNLYSFEIIEKETDLYILASSDLREEAHQSVLKHRKRVESYLRENPYFLSSLRPLCISGDAPSLIREMTRAAEKAGVGPMAAVAGAMAEGVGKDLLCHTPEVIVENGGDIFLKIKDIRCIGIHAGDSPLTGKIALEIAPEDTPLGVCTSAGKVGHSLSFGNADAVTVLSHSTPLADAVATAVGNLIKGRDDIQRGIEFCRRIKGIRGVVIIVDGEMGIWGKIKLSS